MGDNVNVFEEAIKDGKKSHVEYILSLPFIKKVYSGKNEDEESKQLIFRILYHLFVLCKDDGIIEIVLKQLNFDKNTIAQHINFDHPAPKEKVSDDSFKYNEKRIAERMVVKCDLNRLKRLHLILGDSVFRDAVLKPAVWNINALERAIQQGKQSIVSYLLSIPSIKAVYNEKNENEESDKLRFQIVYHIFKSCTNDEMVDEILKELNFGKDVIVKAMKYKYPQIPKEKFAERFFDYFEYNIMEYVVWARNVDRLIKLHSILGDEEFRFAIENSDALNDAKEKGKEKHLSFIQSIL